ncbi:hypothetical protein JS756_09485 [Streptomyces actuosus]|uniref:Uncharacterized protein n=1 Tax=Streptomyces actuosus TaxID=1885 RepID=A0ABS2VMJ7_STRAS|nr:hypothetical protein [Streptomyces actuosus]MBN0044338.1 hypothetical protein [Streptomyces actuosus]
MRGGGARGRAVLRGALPASAAVALCLGPAAAGASAREPGARTLPGPARVTEAGPGRTAALRAGEPGFAWLRDLPKPSYRDTETVPRAGADARCPAARLIVRRGWTAVGARPPADRGAGGDVAVERLDELFVDRDAVTVVRTGPSPEAQDDDIRWRRASRRAYEDPERKGLPGRAPAATDAGGGGPLDGGWWALPGLAVGLALGAGGTALVRRAADCPGTRPPGDDGRRRELTDL